MIGSGADVRRTPAPVTRAIVGYPSLVVSGVQQLRGEFMGPNPLELTRGLTRWIHSSRRNLRLDAADRASGEPHHLAPKMTPRRRH